MDDLSWPSGVFVQMLRQQGGPVANGEALCAIFTGSGVGVATSPLLVPTIDTLTALLDGPRSGPYKNALLELLLIMPCRRAPESLNPSFYILYYAERRRQGGLWAGWQRMISGAQSQALAREDPTASARFAPAASGRAEGSLSVPLGHQGSFSTLLGIYGRMHAACAYFFGMLHRRYAANVSLDEQAWLSVLSKAQPCSR